MKMFNSYNQSQKELIQQIRGKYNRIKEEYLQLKSRIKEKDKNIFNMIKRVNINKKKIDFLVKNIK